MRPAQLADAAQVDGSMPAHCHQGGQPCDQAPACGHESDTAAWQELSHVRGRESHKAPGVFHCPSGGVQFHGAQIEHAPTTFSQIAAWNSSGAEPGTTRRIFSNCGDADTALHVIFNNGHVVACLIIRHTEEVTYHAGLEPAERDAEWQAANNKRRMTSG
jgi:hypothetical protein